MTCSGVLCTLSCEIVIFRRNSQRYRGNDALCRQNDVFYRQNRGPCRPPQKNGNTIEDSSTWGAGARDLGDSATGRPAKHGTFGTTLAPFPGERRGPFAKRTTLSGIDVTDGGRGCNLRHIRSRGLGTIEETTPSVGKMTCFTV